MEFAGSMWEFKDFKDYRECEIVRYGCAVFSRACPKCGRFVKPDPSARVNDMLNEAYGTCKKCGRVELEYLDYEFIEDSFDDI